MELAVSTACLYPMESEKSLETLCKLGFRNFEFFVNSFSEIEKPFLTEMKNILDFYGAKIVSMHPFTCLLEALLFFSDYKRRYDDSIDFYKKYFEAMNFLGADKFILHGQRSFGGHLPLSDMEYCQAYLGLYRAGREFDLFVCQENVNGFRSGKIEVLEFMKKQLGDEIAFVFDNKQAIRTGHNYTDIINIMSDKIKQVHLSDSNENNNCLLPGTGNADLSKVINLLKKHNYNDTVVIEVYSNCFKEAQEIAKSGEFLQNIIL